jgi:hypothetical protein
MNDIVRLGENIIDRDYGITSVLFDACRLTVKLEHVNKKVVIVDFGKHALDCRFSQEFFRINHIADLIEKGEFWPIRLINNSSYLDKINKEELDMMFTLFKNLKHYVIADDDFIIDIMATEDPKIYFESEQPLKES